MGWLDPHHQRKVRRKFHLRTIPFYLCDVCGNPIPPGEPPVVDPRRGYHRRPKGASIYSSREPKWTSCLNCDRERRDNIRHKRERKHRKFLHVINKLIEKIKAKPKNGYWTTEKCIEKLSKYDSRTVVRAIKVLVKERTLKKRHGAYVLRRK